jgi:hypothetical protein
MESDDPAAAAARPAGYEAAPPQPSPSKEQAAAATAPRAAADAATSSSDGDEDANGAKEDPSTTDREIVTFRDTDAYVYAPIPRAGVSGHRAELWNVEKWSLEVAAQVVEETGGRGRGFVRLFEKNDKTPPQQQQQQPGTTNADSNPLSLLGELFAEAPLPVGGKAPLTSVVEPAVDSSRFFVLRVQDRADAKRHAFIGLGFRERAAASAFASALDEYQKHAARLREARALRRARRQRHGAGAEDDGGDAPSSSSGRQAGGGEFALRDGQTVKLNVDLARLRARARPADVDDGGGGFGGGGFGGGGFGGGGSFFADGGLGGENSITPPRRPRMPSMAVAIEGLRLAPPPPPPPSGRVVAVAGGSGGGGGVAGSGDKEEDEREKNDKDDDEDDGFGEFVG